MSEKQPYYQYALDVVEGKVVANRYVKMACRRFLDMLGDEQYYYDEKKVKKVIKFVESLELSTGHFAGKKFKLEPWQKFIVCGLYGLYYTETKRRVTRKAYIEVSRKSGKALSLDTPIPTPTGYTTMGKLRVGDKVLDENGQPCNVTFVTPIMYNHKCYNVTFNDGEVITADADHNWYIDRYHKDKWHVETTQEILDKGYFNMRKDGYVENYVCVPMAKPLEFTSNSTLPIDPYTLGLWLGDGSKKGAYMTFNGDDCNELIEKIPYPYRLKKYDDENAYEVNLCGTTKEPSEFSKLLKANNLKNNKHIPEVYFTASVNERLALLQGLMDTDGCIHTNKNNGSIGIEIQQVNENIANGICRLLDSLCIKYYARKKIPTLNGKLCNEVTRISFNGDKQLPVFRLKRKYDLLPETKGKKNVKYITNIEEVKSVPVKCITVDSPNHLYLCGKNTVTHNTSLLGALSLYELARGGKDAQVYCLAASRDQAHILFDATSEYAKGLDPKEQYFKLLRQEIRLPITNSKCKVLAADASRLDGVNASFFCVDEIEVQPNDKLYSVLATSQGMRLEPLAVCIGSGGNDVNGFGYQMRETCIEVLEGLKQDPSQFSLIYCVDSVEEVENEDMWIKACPNLGVTVQKEYLREQLLSAKNNSALQNFVYSRQFGIWTKSAETWIDDLIVSNNTMEFDPCVLFNGYRTYMGVDLASVCDLTAVAYLCVIDDIYNFYVDYYLPFDSLDQSPYYEIWNKSGHLHITPDNATDFNYITDDIMKKKRDGIRIKEIAYDRYLSSQWVADMFQKGFKMKSFSQSIANFSAPTKEFQRLMLQGRIKIHANPINRWCISNVVLKEDYNQNVKPIKMQNKNKIDGCIAMIQALGIYMGDRKGDPDLKIIA